MKSKVGAVGFVVGLLGVGFAVGGVENAETLAQWVAVLGLAGTSLMLMQMSTWLIKDEI